MVRHPLQLAAMLTERETEKSRGSTQLLLTFVSKPYFHMSCISWQFFSNLFVFFVGLDGHNSSGPILLSNELFGLFMIGAGIISRILF